jgi:hypothetical protein
MRRRIVGIAATVLLALCALRPFSQADHPPPLKSGLQPGERVPTFYVRAITGPLRNKSVCYVCRNGDRPVVMVFIRSSSPGLRQLLKAVDEQIDAHRADGLRGFGVFLAGERKDLLSEVQTLAFEEKLGLPLTIAAATVEGPAGQNLAAAADVTIVLYRDQTVTANFAYRVGELSPSELERVVEAVKKLAE